MRLLEAIEELLYGLGMPLPIIPNTYRVAYNWASGTQRSVNVLHVSALTSTGTAVATRLRVIADGWATANNPWAGLSNGYSLDHIDVIALDGTSAGVKVVPTVAVNGGDTGDQIPQSAMLVSLRTLVRGPKGRGRVYIGPVTELHQSGGFFDSTFVSAVQPKWDAFISSLSTGTPSMQLVVASYAHASANTVQTATVERHSGTQRRRNSRL